MICGAEEKKKLLESEERLKLSTTILYGNLLGDTSIVFTKRNTRHIDFINGKISSAFTPDAMEKYYPVMLQICQLHMEGNINHAYYLFLETPLKYVITLYI